MRAVRPIERKFRGFIMVALVSIGAPTAGCGGVEQTATLVTNVPTTSPPLAPTRPLSAPNASALAATPATAPVGLLQRKDTPPQGVAAQLQPFAAPGIPPDPNVTPPPPRTGPYVEVPESVEIATNFQLTFNNFAPNQPLQAKVTRPDGRVLESQVPVRGNTSASGFWRWTTLPGDPLGVYTVQAVQGPLSAAGHFTVKAASKPRLTTSPEIASLGDVVQVVLAGFEAGQTVQLHLYADDGQGPREYHYVTSLPLIQMDSHGQATYLLPTQETDPKGEYVVMTDQHEESLRASLYLRGRQ